MMAYDECWMGGLSFKENKNNHKCYPYITNQTLIDQSLLGVNLINCN
jgi:hypothetical protein